MFKKNILIFILIFSNLSSVENSPSPDYLYGAIYWPGWVEPYQNIDGYNLTPDEFSYRRPYFTVFDNQGRAIVCENKQEIMDQEIQLAHVAGLDYFAFLYYPNDSAARFNYGRNLYLTSQHKNQIMFSLIIPSSNLTQELWENQYLPNIALDVTMNSYLREAKNNRPVIFFYRAKDILITLDNAKDEISNLRQIVKTSAQGKNPWLVAMASDPVGDGAELIELGFDAVTAYTAHGYYLSGLNQPYQNMMISNSNFWERELQSGLNVVPIVNTGWDGSPRLPESSIYLDHSFSNPNPAQIAQNLQNAISFMIAHPNKTASKLILIYAWNEFSEGGWLIPTTNNYRLNYLSTNIFGGTQMNKPYSQIPCS